MGGNIVSVQNVSSFQCQGYVQPRIVANRTVVPAIPNNYVQVAPRYSFDELYTKEEKELLAKNPNANLVVYHADKGNYSRMLDNMYYSNEEKEILEKYITNPSFKNIMENKFIKGNSERIKSVVNIIYKLGRESEDVKKEVNTPGYFCPYLPDSKIYKASINVNTCIKTLDNFISSNFSDDLKEYMILDGSKLSDLWYVGMDLNNFQPDSKSVKDLTHKFYIL